MCIMCLLIWYNIKYTVSPIKHSCQKKKKKTEPESNWALRLNFQPTGNTGDRGTS